MLLWFGRRSCGTVWSCGKAARTISALLTQGTANPVTCPQRSSPLHGLQPRRTDAPFHASSIACVCSARPVHSKAEAQRATHGDSNHEGPSTAESAEPILELLDGFRKSQTLLTACRLGLFDTIARMQAHPMSHADRKSNNNSNNKEGIPRPVTVKALAKAMGASTDGLQRLLDACEGLHLVEKRPTHRDESGHISSCYSNTTTAERHLLASSPLSMVGYINHSRSLLYPLWAHLDASVENGRPAWHEAFGLSHAEIFNNIYADQSAKERFLAGMHSFGLLSSPAVVDAVDLSPFKAALDVGGGSGHLAMALKRKYGDAMQVAVADLPDLLGVTETWLAKEGFRDSISVVPCDFFREVPSKVSAKPHAPTAAAAQGSHDIDQESRVDLILLSRILHDWTDAECHEILSNCFRALPSGGGIVVADMLLHNDTGRGPLRAQLQSLNMLVQTKGKERSCEQFTHLLEAAGFTDVTCTQTSAYLDVVLATKP